MNIPSLFSSSASGATALGLYVTKQAVRVAILQQEDEGYVVRDCYTRKRGQDFSSSASEADTLPTSFDDGPPAEASGDDYSIAFGDDQGLDGDLPGAGGVGGDSTFSVDAGGDQASTSPPQGTDLAPLLRDIMEAAESQYGGDLEVAFCIGAPEVTSELLREESGGDEADEQRPSRRRLLARLNAEFDRNYTGDDVAFVPAASGPGRAGHTVAVARAQNDVVTSALHFLHNNSLRSLPLVRLMEAELTLYRALLAGESYPDDEERTAVLRVGAEDTFVMFLEGDRLRYQEYLRSITTLEAADTVCSRVLLQQDEAGIDTVDRIVLIAEDREDEFVDRLHEFYPDAEIVTFGQVFRQLGVTLENADRTDQENIAPWVPAVGAAVRLLSRTSKKELRPVNLLPDELRRRKSAVQVAWHTIAMALVLFLIGFFFTSRYYQQQEEISELQQQINEYPASLELTGEQLQGRIDSLQTVYDRYQNALVSLDTVLTGSDRWSRMLARTVRHAQHVPGVWIEEWHPQEETVNLIGFATERDGVVRLSNRLNATVEQLTSTSIREYPVFQYSITAPLPAGLPRSVRYLREQELALANDDNSPVPTP